MPYATNQGLRINYRVEGSGPPLVLQHGYTWHLGGWTRCGYVEPMKSHYQLILVDARGHGASDKPHDPDAYRLPLKVGDVVAVLDALHVPSAHFWGYSMGGWIGWGMAKYAPERVQGLVIGGAHPYALATPPRSRRSPGVRRGSREAARVRIRDASCGEAGRIPRQRSSCPGGGPTRPTPAGRHPADDEDA